MPITKDLFGSHMILTKDVTDEGGPFDRFNSMMDIENWRYPGGTVTEDLRHDDGSLYEIFGEPNLSGGQDRVTTVREALDYAHDNDGSITFVLPTETFLNEGAYGERSVNQAAVDEFMTYIDDMIRGEYGPAAIKSFEIGNEYWINNSRMTAEEYAEIVNYMAPKLDEIIQNYANDPNTDPNWDPPEIGIQAGAYWRTGENENMRIIDNLDPEAKAVVDQVIFHFYPRNLDEVDGRSGLWRAVDQFERDPEFGDLDIHFSEWNVSSSKDGADLGMSQASSFIELFDTMVENGVDEANVWGTNYKSLNSSLADMSHNHWEGVAPEDIDLNLSPAGEAFRMLSQNTIGKDRADLTSDDVLQGVIPSSDDLLVHSYEDDAQVVVFLSSRSDQPLELDLDLEGFPGGYDHLSAVELSARDDLSTPRRDEGDPNSTHTRAYVETHSQDDLESSGGMIELDPYGIAMIRFSRGDVGLRLEGSDQQINPSDDMSDELVGWIGHDTIRGHFGDDTLSGQSGKDILEGGEGNDFVLGGEQTDVLIDGSGTDILFGGDGRDALISEGGDDLVSGEDGDDILVSLGGDDTLSGGDGANLFMVHGAGDRVVSDFDASKGDVIDFSGSFDSPESLREAMRVEVSDSGTEDLIIDLPDEGSVRLVGIGANPESVLSSVRDFMTPEDQLFELTSRMEDMTPAQAEAFVAELYDAGFDPFSGAGPADIEAALPPTIAQAVLSVTDPDFEMMNPPTDSTPPSTPTDPMDTGSGEAPDESEGPDIPEPVSPPPAPSPRPEDPEDEDRPEDEDEGPDNPGSASCFVATAAYKDSYHPDVVYLRRFREEVLRPSALGRKFIRAYWKVGPILARPVHGSQLLGAIAKASLRAAVFILQKIHR